MDDEKRLLVLETDGNLQNRVHRFKKGINLRVIFVVNGINCKFITIVMGYCISPGWKLYFVCDPILQTRKVRLFTNYPQPTDEEIPKIAREFNELNWQTDENSHLVGGYSCISNALILNRPGSYKFYYTCDERWIVIECLF